MPKLLEKHKVLDGRAEILRYENYPDVWYYREKRSKERAYKTRKISNIKSKKQAIKAAIDIYAELRNEEDDSYDVRNTPATKEEIERSHLENELVSNPVSDARLSSNGAEHNNGIGGAYLITDKSNPLRTGRFLNRKKKGIPINDCISDYLKQLHDRVEANELKENSFKEYLQTLSVHLSRYLHQEGVKFSSQITSDTFTRYPIYRKGAAKLTKNKEARHIKAFVDHYLAKRRLIDVEVATNKKLIPLSRITQEDLDANPAINPHDWKLINSFIRNKYLRDGALHPRPSVYYWRYLFWHFTLIMKNSGCRPVELINLRWKDVKIEDVGRISQTKLEEEVQYYESEGIEVRLEDDELDVDPNAFSTSEEQLGREERLIAHIFVRASKTGKPREIPCNVGKAFKRFKEFQDEYLRINQMQLRVTPDTLIFGNPHKSYEKYDYQTYTMAWWKVRDAVRDQLIGHKFSERDYTIYSMRSTFIEDKLLAKMDIFLLSRICGHSVEMLQKHYERIDVKERAEEITRLPYGEKKKKGTIDVDLFE